MIKSLILYFTIKQSFKTKVFRFLKNILSRTAVTNNKKYNQSVRIAKKLCDKILSDKYDYHIKKLSDDTNLDNYIIANEYDYKHQQRDVKIVLDILTQYLLE